VAQSPEQNAGSSAILRYDLGWKAINDLLRSGRSLSGHERNCCFLNLGASGSTRFADVSAAVDLDLIDDGRVLALSDWDFDGDVDFWVANRSGPQVRWLRNPFNDGSGQRNFAAFALRGVTSNRDAIGARVTLQTSGGRRQVQSLREGYLAQSSKWIHFGLAADEQVTALAVDWPNGRRQEFKELAANRWYILTEGMGEAETWVPPSGMKPLTPEPFTAPPATEKARIVLLSPLPLPSLGGLTENIGHARLVNLWAHWCAPCLTELREWKDHAADFQKARLEILALNVDETEDRGKWDALGLPFTYRYGAKELAAQFDALQRSLLSLQSPLPVPSSFLIDAQGRLRVVYKGPVSAAQLLADMQLIEADSKDVLIAATPFPGRWHTPPGGTNPMHLAITFIEGGHVAEAEGYVRSLLEKPEHQSAELFDLLGGMLIDKKQLAEAGAAFQGALRLDPNDRKAHVELGTLLLGIRKGAEAESHFTAVLKANPNDPELVYKLGISLMLQGRLAEARDQMLAVVRLNQSSLAHWQLGEIHIGLGDPRKAIESYEAAIALNPELLTSANNLAWLLATSAEASLRNGPRAVEIAEAIHRAGNSPEAQQPDTLAAAYAEAGRFDEAVATLSKLDKLSPEMQSRLQLYRERKPFHEPLNP
jgi:tetratricopeptide (TPR) repeat protein